MPPDNAVLLHTAVCKRLGILGPRIFSADYARNHTKHEIRRFLISIIWYYMYIG
jgi:hypothetical protein